MSSKPEMAPSNATLVRRAFEAIGERGLDGALDFLDPDVEFDPPEEAIEQRGTFVGHQAVRDRWNLLLEPFDEVQMELEDVVEGLEETVVVVFRIHARGKASGAPVEMRLAHVVTVHDGRAVRLKAYLDPEAAKRAAGLRPATAEPNLQIAARLNEEVIPAGDWVAALADEDAVRERLRALGEIAWPDVEVAMIAPGGLTGTFHGIDGFLEAWRDWLVPFDAYHVQVEGVQEAGAHVVVLVHHTATPKGTEATVEGDAAAVMTFRDGRLARIEFTLDRDDAKRAAGLLD